MYQTNGPGFSIGTADEIPVFRRDVASPNAARLINALRQIGYTLEQAISDLIDNSITAGARHVLIRFVHDWENILGVTIADDGSGMTPVRLREAMRFGSEEEADPASLSKYGLGMKLASFSHARKLTVLTRANGRASGRRWTIDGISQGWSCELLKSRNVNAKFRGGWAGLDLTTSGTLVVWHDIDKLKVSARGIRWTLGSIQKRLEVHLGMCFHRFIEDNRLSIFLDQQTMGSFEHPVRVMIAPLNPFKYPASGNPDYPRTFCGEIDALGSLNVDAHVWPPNSPLPEYSLGNRAAARQGFYFYRNDRLIQAGGWNGLVQQDAEPHSSLARVAIDLSPELDSGFGLNVQKSAVVVPPGFHAAISHALSPDGTGFEQYRHDAIEAYRLHDRRATNGCAVIPGRGIPSKLRREMKHILNGDDETRYAEWDFVWVSLSTDKLLDVDHESKRILLNKSWRGAVESDSNTGVGPATFKIMLFALLENHLRSGKVSRPANKRLDVLNRLLLTSLEYESAK